MGLVLALVPFTAQADILASYTVTTVQTGDTELPPSTILAGVSASSFAGAGGLLAFGLDQSAFGGFVQGSLFVDFGDPAGWPLLNFDSEALEATLTPPPGFQFRLTSIDWAFGAISSTMHVAIRTSFNNFGTPIDGPFTIPRNQGGTGPTSLTSLPLINRSITFRWYAYSEGDFTDSSPYGGFVENGGAAVRFNGTLVPLPKVTSVQRTSSSSPVQIQGKGAPSVIYNVQETATLLTMPQTVTTTSADIGGNFQYNETPPNGTTRRFYRFQQP